MDDDFHPRLPSRDFPGYLGAVISRGVVDDEHPYIHALLVIQDAGDSSLKELAIVVTGDNDAD